MTGKTSDIVERLRGQDETIRYHIGHDLGMTENQWLVAAQDLRLAADEIERLREERDLHDAVAAIAKEEVERLREENRCLLIVNEGLKARHAT